MTWEVAGVIAEVIGAVAVVATLLFLAIEIRHNRMATQAATVDGQSAGINALNTVTVSDPEFAKIWIEGLADPDRLDEVNRMRLALHLQSYINHYTALRRQRSTGALPGENWEYYAHAMGTLMNSPGARKLAPHMTIDKAVAKELEEYRGVESDYIWLPKEGRIKHPPNTYEAPVSQGQKDSPE